MGGDTAASALSYVSALAGASGEVLGVVPQLRARAEASIAEEGAGSPALLWMGPRAELGGEIDHERRTERWRFSDLWARASAIAVELRHLAHSTGWWATDGDADVFRIGVGIDEGVGLPLVELAVLLAGGAIVPLDPRDPCRRLACALEDAELALVVAKDVSAVSAVEEAAAAAFPLATGGRRPPVVLLQTLLDAVASPAATAASVDKVAGGVGNHGGYSSATDAPIPPTSWQASAGSLASTSHVFFTSGSTGRPKGCVVTHRSLAHYVAARNAFYKVGADSICLVASAHTFDPSLGDLMATWIAGGCVALAPRASLFAHLGRMLSVSNTSHICCTPSLFGTLTGTAFETPDALPCLRVVALGGEPTPPAIQAAWTGRTRLRLLNTYGVTECCVYNSARDVNVGDSPALVGEPLLGNVLGVVRGDHAQEETAEEADDLGKFGDLPCGEVGELLIAGAQVGEGYARRPELTRERFVDHSRFGRSYLTGDLARRDVADILLLGRRDNQVKIRGHRIEIDEVEHLLLASAGPLLVSAAASCLDGKLYAFCVPPSGIRVGDRRATAALRAALRWLCERGLPTPMRPQRYVFSAALPLTGSGKIARGQLRELLSHESSNGRLAADGEGSDGEAEECHGGGVVGRPLSALEAVIAEVWAAELSQPVGNLGHTADFRDLGGHSIAALRVCRCLALRMRASDSLSGDTNDDSEAALGGDLGEISGPFAPAELLARPRLNDYAAFLEASGLVDRCVGLQPPVTAATVDVAATGEKASGDRTATATDAAVDEADADHSAAADRVDCDTGFAAVGADGVALLHRAALAGAVPIIDFLVGFGHAPVDGNCSMKRLKAATRAQRSLRQVGQGGDQRPPAPLHSAASTGGSEAVAALLRLRATVTATEGHGVMALHLAANRGTSETLKLLLAARAPLAAKDMNTQTALHFAARAGNVDTLPLLLDRWLADDSLVSQGSRVYGGPLDWRDRWHRTPVHWAALNNHADALDLLLTAKASAEPPRIRDARHSKSTTLRHESPLAIAQRRGNQTVVDVFVRHGAAATGATHANFEQLDEAA
eukprot:TRINITY_DN62646_c0_g1_i1.p1 TRINITY_DN62646_c0_g1~~TRINITY_DN62646_c0_g1_i1.p1  ORF type:complete len:1063 (-),score=176.82 TRINITY_DN62646_c0_g1_i1:50-3238(-)